MVTPAFWGSSCLLLFLRRCNFLHITNESHQAHCCHSETASPAFKAAMKYWILKGKLKRPLWRERGNRKCGMKRFLVELYYRDKLKTTSQISNLFVFSLFQHNIRFYMTNSWGTWKTQEHSYTTEKHCVGRAVTLLQGVLHTESCSSPMSVKWVRRYKRGVIENCFHSYLNSFILLFSVLEVKPRISCMLCRRPHPLLVIQFVHRWVLYIFQYSHMKSSWL